MRDDEIRLTNHSGEYETATGSKSAIFQLELS